MEERTRLKLQKKLGPDRGLEACDGHEESMARGYKGCLDREHVFEIIKNHREQITTMKNNLQS